MADKLEVTRVWAYRHDRAVDSVSLAGLSGETIISDRRERIVFIDASGSVLWDKKTDFSPLAVRLTDTADAAYILTLAGHLLRVTRDAELEWDLWVDRQPLTLEIKAKGQAAAVICRRGRIHIVNMRGKRIRLLHAPESVAHARISPGGALFVASAQGWLGRYDRSFSPNGEMRLGRDVFGVEVSERGRKIVLPGKDDGLGVISLDDSSMTAYNPGFSVIKAGMDEKGEKIAAVGLEGDIAVLNIEGETLWRSKTDHSWVQCEMSRAGDRFVVVSDKGFAACYGVGQGRPDRAGGHFDYLEI